jgi:hypothetical protein
MADLRMMMTRRQALQSALAASIALLLFFAARASYRFYRFKKDANEPVGPWMSLGYAARAHGIDPGALHLALGFTPGKPERGPLGGIAKRHGFDVKDFMVRVNAEVERLKAESAAAAPAP